MIWECRLSSAVQVGNGGAVGVSPPMVRYGMAEDGMTNERSNLESVDSFLSAPTTERKTQELSCILAYIHSRAKDGMTD